MAEKIGADTSYICVKALEKGVNIIGVTRGEVTKIHHTEKLDQVTHPAVLDACVQQAKIPAVLDAPQLFESGADALCAYTLAVTAPEDTRRARIMERDGIDRAAARLRMQAQPAADFYTEKCTFTVTNDGRDIKSQVNRILEAIL